MSGLNRCAFFGGDIFDSVGYSGNEYIGTDVLDLKGLRFKKPLLTFRVCFVYTDVKILGIFWMV